MNDRRATRIATLKAAAKSRSAEKTEAAERAIRMLVKKGEPITFQAVQREAGVSHAFLYGHAEIRSRIEHLRAQWRAVPPPTTSSDTSSESSIVLALTTQIKRLREQHRRETAELTAALQQAHGEKLALQREVDRRG
jgi:hypothetical protein